MTIQPAASRSQQDGRLGADALLAQGEQGHGATSGVSSALPTALQRVSGTNDLEHYLIE
jgi:hypothetical protein